MSSAELYGVAYYRGEKIATYGEDDGTDRKTLDLQTPVLLDPTQHSSKPTGSDVASISRRIIQPAHLYRPNVETLAKAISCGYTVCGGICVGKRSPNCWKSQQLWCIDIDNDAATKERGYDPLPYTEAVLRAFRANLPLVISYLTFSSSPDPYCPADSERYRLMFRRGAETSDPEEAAAFGAALLATYPEADQSTAQSNRLFFGTDKEVLAWNRPLV